MTWNIVNPPHPTPNPDQPHAPGPDAGRKAPEPLDPAEAASEELIYDSCYDDLNLILSQSIEQPDPDPNLEPPLAAHPSRSEPVPSFLQDRKKQPRTSEIFRAVGAQIGDAGGPAARSSPGEDLQTSPPCEPRDRAAREAPGEAFVVPDREPQIKDLVAEEEDPLAEPHLSWGHLLLLSYSSAITLALAWILWTGPGAPVAQPPPTGTNAAVADPPRESSEPVRSQPPPPIPSGNLARLRQTVQLGDLEITPLAVVAARLELVRSSEPAQYRREREESLVLCLRVTNRSQQRSFAPLGPTLVRERGLRPLDPYIATTQGPKFRLFPLAVESEWSILGQEFPELGPGDTATTIIAAEPGSAARLAGEMTWRVRLRTGVYRTDLLGVPFTQEQVRHVRRLDEAEEESPL